MSVSVQIEKLGEDNYDVWSISMRSILVTQDLWSVASGSITKPLDSSECANWEIIDQTALASLILNVKPTQLMHIKHCSSAYLAWRKLREIHPSGSPAKKVQLYQKLMGLNLHNGESVNSYINAFTETSDKLTELEIRLQDDLKVIMLLSNLPSSWESFVVAIETRDKLPSFDTVKVKLLEEGARKEERDKRERTDQAVYAHRNFQSKGTVFKSRGKASKDEKQTNIAREIAEIVSLSKNCNRTANCV
nr:uncharacterized protein LOC123002424 [Drosophila takahashii]